MARQCGGARLIADESGGENQNGGAFGPRRPDDLDLGGRLAGDAGAGRTDLGDAAISRDFVSAIVLALVVTSPVLSPQYMVWLLGLAAVVLSAGTTRLARPAWIVVGATILSTALFRSPELILIRDLALLVATIDGATALVTTLND